MAYYNLKVTGPELSCIITGLSTVIKDAEGDPLKEDQEMFARGARDKAEALAAWIDADIAASKARGQYYNTLHHGKEGF